MYKKFLFLVLIIVFLFSCDNSPAAVEGESIGELKEKLNDTTLVVIMYKDITNLEDKIGLSDSDILPKDLCSWIVKNQPKSEGDKISVTFDAVTGKEVSADDIQSGNVYKYYMITMIYINSSK